jgi:hypothetical protein
MNAFSGAANRFREAANDVVAWQSDGMSFSWWPPIAIDDLAGRPSVKLSFRMSPADGISAGSAMTKLHHRPAHGKSTCRRARGRQP